MVQSPCHVLSVKEEDQLPSSIKRWKYIPVLSTKMFNIPTGSVNKKTNTKNITATIRFSLLSNFTPFLSPVTTEMVAISVMTIIIVI